MDLGRDLCAFFCKGILKTAGLSFFSSLMAFTPERRPTPRSRRVVALMMEGYTQERTGIKSQGITKKQNNVGMEIGVEKDSHH